MRTRVITVLAARRMMFTRRGMVFGAAGRSVTVFVTMLALVLATARAVPVTAGAASVFV